MPPGPRSGKSKIKSHQMTDKQKRLVGAALNPNITTLTEMGRVAGYYDATNAQRGLKSPKVQNAIELALERKKVDEPRAARVLYEAQDAMYGMAVGGRLIKLPDHNVRGKADEDYLKIKKYIGNGPESAAAEQHLHLHLGDKNTQEILAEIKSQIESMRSPQ